MTYDVRRLHLNGLIRPLLHTNRYTLTNDGIRIAVFYTNTEARKVNLPPETSYKADLRLDPTLRGTPHCVARPSRRGWIDRKRGRAAEGLLKCHYEHTAEDVFWAAAEVQRVS
jgi:hypothetical protein